MTDGEALLEQVEGHLEQALSECSAEQKNYHIRSALQAYYIGESESSDLNAR